MFFNKKPETPKELVVTPEARELIEKIVRNSFYEMKEDWIKEQEFRAAKNFEIQGPIMKEGNKLYLIKQKEKERWGVEYKRTVEYFHTLEEAEEWVRTAIYPVYNYHLRLEE